MTITLLLVAIVILLCVLAEKFSGKFGMPALILFMFIGMLFGSDGIFKIPFDDYRLAEDICSIALLFIMFYGGFNLKWKAAKSVAVKSILLSTIGVAVTAVVTALFVQFFLGYTWLESFLVGAVLGSTDAASVFAILRKKKLNLRDGSASLLEMESGSNDPMAYMLTFIAVEIISAGKAEHIFRQIVLQLAFGTFIGAAFAFLTIRLLRKTNLISEGLDTIFMVAMLLICYALSQLSGGNAYLSVYIMGICIGNSPIKSKATLIAFFDGVTTLAQILIFFLLGLLTFPHQMPAADYHDHSDADCPSHSSLFTAKAFSLFRLAVPFGILGRTARRFFFRVCNYGSRKRYYNASQPVSHCLYGVSLFRGGSGHASA